MKKIVLLFFTVMLLMSQSVTVFATEDLTEIDVFVEVVSNIEGQYSDEIENSVASVTTDDDVTITITGAPGGTVTLIVTPMKGEAKSWISGCVDGSVLTAYDIYFLDADSNRINVDGVKVSITVPTTQTELMVSSVITSGTTQRLTAEFVDGKIIFTADGSHYYAIAEKTAQPDPDEEHNVIVKDTQGGTVEVSNTTPKTGETVTITVKPDNGKVVDQVTVTDENGKVIQVTTGENGTYTFVQPDGDVTVKVVFKNISTEELPQTGDPYNLWLWIILLLISGMLLICTGNKMRIHRTE